MALSDLCPTYSYRDEDVFGSDIRGRLFFCDVLYHLVPAPFGATVVWCYSLVLLFGAFVWCYCLVLLFGTTVWCFCLALLFGAGGRLFFGDVLWCRLRLVPGLDWWPPSLLVVVQCGAGLPRVSF